MLGRGEFRRDQSRQLGDPSGARGLRRTAAVLSAALALSGLLTASAAFGETRSASRSAQTYENLSDSEALATARQRFPWLLDAPPLRWPPAGLEDELKGYLSERAAVVGRGTDRRGLVESSLPLRGRTPDGRRATIDLGLVDVGNSAFAPKSAAAAVRIPASSDGQLRFPGQSFGLRLEGARSQAAAINQNKAFFANIAEDSDLVLEPRPQGAELSVVLRSPAAPSSIPLRFDLAAGQRLRFADSSRADRLPPGSVELVEDDTRVAAVYPAAAVDAEGTAVPVSYRLDGERLAMEVDSTGDLAWPVLVDPPIGVYDNNGNSAGAGTPGYTWPGWYPVAYAPTADTTGTTWSYCNNQAANPSKKFYFCQGNLSGASWTGGPLYIKANASQSYLQDYYAQWVKDARPDAYIYRLDAAGLANVGAYQAHLVVGVRKADGSNWEDGSVLWGNGDDSRGAITSLSAAYRTEEGTALVWATRYLFVHAANQAQVSPAPAKPITPGNRAVLRMVMDAGPPGTPLPFVQLDGAATYSSETYGPSFSQVAHTKAPPGAAWVDSYTDTVTLTAHDRGLGMGTIALTGSGANVSTSDCVPNDGPGETAKNYYDSCIADLTLSKTYSPSEGVNNYLATATDLVRNQDSTKDQRWTVKLDKTPPTIASLSGSLYDHRNQPTDHRGEGLYDSSYQLTVAANDERGGVATAGVQSVSFQVDGVTKSTVTPSCAGQDNCPANPTWTFTPDDYTDGTHTVQVVVKDRLAGAAGATPALHTTSQSFQVTVDRRGDIYHAAETTGDLANGGDLETEEWARTNTYVSRREDANFVQTRSAVSCGFGMCDQVRTRGRRGEVDPSDRDSFSVYTGITLVDDRLVEASTLLEIQHDGPPGPVGSSGPLNAALATWQRPPPGHGDSYDMYVSQPTDGSDGSFYGRLWIDRSTRMPLKEEFLEADGSVLEAHYWSYDMARLNTSEVSANFFSLDPPAQIGYDQYVAMQGNQAIGLVQDQLTGAVFQPYYLGAATTVGGGALCLASVDTTRDRDLEPRSIPPPSPNDPPDETDGSVRDLTIFTTVDAYYNLASAGATCDPALAGRRDTSAPDLELVSLAKGSPQAAEERDAFTAVGDPVPVIPGIGAGSAGGIPRVAYVISEPGERTAALVDLDTTTLLFNGAYAQSELASLVARLETR